MPTVTSPCSNPITDSEKAIVTSKGPAWASAGPLMVTVGASRSTSTENWVAAVLPFPSSSTATPAATSTVTVPLAVGSIKSVAVAPDPANEKMLPLPTVTSVCSNPVTDSEKVIVTLNGNAVV